MPDGVGKQWGSLRQTRPWRYAASLTGMLHLVSLALSVLCVAFAGHYLGMYQGVHVPGYDLFRPEAFFVIAGVACMVVTTLLLATVLASAESQELLFRTLAPELAFGVMSGLWLVASIVYMAEIVGRNMDYLFRERGFPLKILTAVLALAAACLDAALCLLSHRHRSAIYSPQLKAAPSVESGARPAQLTIGTPPAHEATQRSSFGGVEARPERHRMERAPSSPPFVGQQEARFSFAAAPAANSVVSLQGPSESVRRLTEKTLSQSVSLKSESSAPAPAYVPAPTPEPPPAETLVSKPLSGRRGSAGSGGAGGEQATRSLAGSADHIGGKTREMRRSVSTPGDVEEPLAVAGTKFASTDYLASDPANLSFSQRLKMLEQRKANGS
ncbi:uncharacterized protein LOC119105407 [Pollicipes pollicipes]|uniref:uncharacterized protein LOC119105407 n=1 Tax=Pollicipes pollicipes TaxID=41117 RepID=UPI001884D618|nr:uncharacterized protein LOC119105407 [Pollicipes pollicipes]